MNIYRFKQTITAEFNGHLHSDEFKIFYNGSDPVAMAWGVGSSTSYSDYNVNYKIATIDNNTFVSILVYENSFVICFYYLNFVAFIKKKYTYVEVICIFVLLKVLIRLNEVKNYCHQMLFGKINKLLDY